MTDKLDLTDVVQAMGRERKGCSILDAMQGKTINEQLAAIHGLNDSDKGVYGKIYVDGKRLFENAINIEVEKHDGFLNNKTLFSERILGASGLIKYTCTDYTDAGHSSKAKEVSLF